MKKNSIYITLISIITIYAIVGFVAVPKLLKPQLEKVINENITQKATLEKIEFNPFLLKFSLQNLKIFDEKQTTIKIDKLYVDFAVLRSIDEQHIAFKDLKLENPYINVIEYEDGSFNLQKLVKEQEKSKNEEKQNTKENSDIKFQIYKTVLDNATIDFTKIEKDNKPYKLNISKFDYTFYDMGTFRNILASHSLRMLINQNSELEINGGLRLSPFKMYGNIELKNIRPNQFLAYKKDLLNFNLSDETYVDLKIGYKVNTEDKLNVILNDGYLALNNLDISQNKQSLVSLENLAIDNINVQYPKSEVTIESIILNKLNTNAIIDKNGKINFSKLVANEVNPKQETTQKDDTKAEDIKKDENSKEQTKEETPWKIALQNFDLKNSNLKFDDLSNQLYTKTSNINLALKNLNLDGTDINIASISLGKPTLSIKDNKNKLDILNKNLELSANNISLKDKKVSLNQITLKNSALDFKDLKNRLSIFTKKSDITVSDIVKNDTDISIAGFKFNNPSIYFKDSKNSMNIISNSNLITAKSFNLKGEDLSLDNASINIPTVKFKDEKNKLNITTKNIKLSANKTSLKKQKLNIASLKLAKPSVYLSDNKNNQTIVAKNINLKVNNLNSHNGAFGVSSIYLYEPQVSIKNKTNKTDILAKNINVNINKISFKNNQLKVVSSNIKKPFVSISLGKKDKEKEEKKQINEKVVKKTARKESDFKFDIGPVQIKEMKMSFEDKNLPIPFKTNITQLEGKFSRLNSSNSKPTKLELEGKVDEYGYTKITGTVDINDIKLLTDTNLLFKNIAIKNFTPYSGKFIGREIESGKLNLDLKYNIKKSDLKAENSVIISDIKLGKNVESPDAVNLPLELAIALLEDSDGVINIELPVSGNVDDPQFSIAPIVWKVFTNLIVKAITSPFALLGAMLGIDEEKIKSIEFEFGKSDILASEKESLDNIAKLLSKKPKLAIKISPVYNPSKDKLALQDMKFEQFIIKQMEKIPEGDDYKEALEEFYEELKDVKELDKVEESFVKKDKKGKEYFDNDGYVEYLRKLLASKQTVKEEELISLAKQRIEKVKNYLITEKKVSKEALIIEDISKQEKDKNKWAVFNFDVSTR